jgi:hypothetical protein
MKQDTNQIIDLDQEDLARLVVDFCHRIVMHHAMWFNEVKHQWGREKAYDILSTAYDKSIEIQMKRLGKILGFNTKNGIPEPLLNLPREKLENLKNSLAANWLANDGVWFQTIEFSKSMSDAKRCNDTCWAHFSPFEAWSIKKFLGLSKKPGLKGLKKALQFRLYAAINTQSITDETSRSFVFRMNQCRVQAARKRKGLDDYPCKSAGLVEYSSFGESIDSRIQTQCIACPPDNHPEDWYCAWRFYLD